MLLLGPSKPSNDGENVPLRTNADLIEGEDERNGANTNRDNTDPIGTVSCSIHPCIASAITTTPRPIITTPPCPRSIDDDIVSKDEIRNDNNDTANQEDFDLGYYVSDCGNDNDDNDNGDDDFVVHDDQHTILTDGIGITITNTNDKTMLGMAKMTSGCFVG